MFEKNGICYAGEMTEQIRVSDVKPLQGRMMLVTFSTGEKRLFDTTTLTGSAFDKLADRDIFFHPSIFHGVITWDNGEIDVAPEYVYQNSFAYEEEFV